MGRLVGWTAAVALALAIGAAPAAAQSFSVGVHIGAPVYGPVYGPYYGPSPYPYYPPPVYYPPVYGAVVYGAPIYAAPVYRAPVYGSRVYYPAYGYPARGPYYRPGYYRGGAVVVNGQGGGRYYGAPQGRGPANYRRRYMGRVSRPAATYGRAACRRPLRRHVRDFLVEKRGRDDPVVEVAEIQLLVGRVRVLVRQSDAEQHARHAELLLKRRDDRD